MTHRLMSQHICYRLVHTDLTFKHNLTELFPLHIDTYTYTHWDRWCPCDDQTKKLIFYTTRELLDIFTYQLWFTTRRNKWFTETDYISLWFSFFFVNFSLFLTRRYTTILQVWYLFIPFIIMILFYFINIILIILIC